MPRFPDFPTRDDDEDDESPDRQGIIERIIGDGPTPLGSRPTPV